MDDAQPAGGNKSTAARLIVSIAAGDVDRISGELWAMGTIGIEEQGNGRHVTLLAGFDDPVSAEAAAITIGGEVELIERDAGLDEWRKWAQPFTAGRFWLVPAWLDDPTPQGHQRIELEPGRAFGSGSHVTTRLALRTISALDLDESSTLDMGCGTGVLAIACALSGALVKAVDHDQKAVDSTLDNARRNNVADRIGAAMAIGPPLHQEFDLITANLLLADLEPIAQAIVDCLGPDGVLITTGHLVEQRDRVRKAIDLPCLDEATEDGWSVLTFGRRGGIEAACRDT